jgi:hypothetical protein
MYVYNINTVYLCVCGYLCICFAVVAVAYVLCFCPKYSTFLHGSIYCSPLSLPFWPLPTIFYILTSVSSSSLSYPVWFLGLFAQVVDSIGISSQAQPSHMFFLLFSCDSQESALGSLFLKGPSGCHHPRSCRLPGNAKLLPWEDVILCQCLDPKLWDLHLFHSPLMSPWPPYPQTQMRCW